MAIQKKTYASVFTIPQWESLSEGFEYLGKCYARNGGPWPHLEAAAFEAFLAAEKLLTPKDTGINFEGSLGHYDAIEKGALAYFVSLYKPDYPNEVVLHPDQSEMMIRLLEKCKEARDALTYTKCCAICNRLLPIPIQKRGLSKCLDMSCRPRSNRGPF